MSKVLPIGSKSNPAPSVDEYLSAISQINLTEIRSEMLRVHFQRPRHTITAGQMARAMNWPKHGYANIRYGDFAKAISEILAKPIPKGHIALTMIARLSRPSEKAQWRWAMHPTFAEAVEQLNLGVTRSKKEGQVRSGRAPLK